VEEPTQQPTQQPTPTMSEFSQKKLVAGVCGIIIGWLGIHKFILGFNTAGIIMVLVTVLSCFLLSPVMSIIGLVEGIIYLTKTDEDFYQTYAIEKKEWF
jgi:TM2 domain-containing membrane protein YozV